MVEGPEGDLIHLIRAELPVKGAHLAGSHMPTHEPEGRSALPESDSIQSAIGSVRDRRGGAANETGLSALADFGHSAHGASMNQRQVIRPTGEAS